MAFYKAKNIDVDLFLEELNSKIEFEIETHNINVAAEDARHNAAMEKLKSVRDMFFCRNYEKGE